MKKNTLFTCMAVALLPWITGCGYFRQVSRPIKVTPAEVILSPDSVQRLLVNLRFHVPAHYLSKRCRLVMTPRLVAGDSLLADYDPVILDTPIYSKKQHRLAKLKGYTDPYAERAVRLDDPSRSFDFDYTDSLRVPAGLQAARLYALVQSHGCGKCSQVDTVSVTGVADPWSLASDEDLNWRLDWTEPRFVVRPKVMEGQGTAHLQFAMNVHQIDPALGQNRAELDQMVKRLSIVVTDTLATLQTLYIYGMASADGPLSFNTALAQRRAAEAKKYLLQALRLSQPEVQGIKVGSRPEGWFPVLQAMKADSHPDTVAVQNILNRYARANDDVQERYIRRLPAWDDIRRKYLSKDRKVEYVYTYSVRSFTTDADLLRMFGSRPDAFNEEEMLRVAALMKEDTQKEKVYLKLIQKYPQSQVARQNLAILSLRKGDAVHAARHIEALEQPTDTALNTLAVAYAAQGQEERAGILLRSLALPQARYNLGLLCYKQHRLKEAYLLLQPFADVRTAICALALRRTDEADKVMRKVQGQTPVEEYVRAVIAARLGRDAEVCAHLTRVSVNEKLSRRALDEPDFFRFYDKPEFKAAILSRD